MRKFLAVTSLMVLGAVSVASCGTAAEPDTKKAAPADMKADAKKGPAAAGDMTTDDQKTLYAIGLAISQNLGPFSLTEADLALIQAGLADGVLNREKKVDLQVYGPKIQQLAAARASVAAAAEKKLGAEYLAKAEKEKGAKKTASGLIYIETKAGTGETPKATDKVKVHYTGKLIDGSTFDSTATKGEPMVHPVNGFVPCWTEALQLMKTGGKAHLTCPADIAYGDRGMPPMIKPGATLQFDIELLSIEK